GLGQSRDRQVTTDEIDFGCTESRLAANIFLLSFAGPSGVLRSNLNRAVEELFFHIHWLTRGFLPWHLTNAISARLSRLWQARHCLRHLLFPSRQRRRMRSNGSIT